MFVTREELYRLVSERPLNKVAPELGLSATALARVCQSHNIPYPGSGKTHRLQAGNNGFNAMFAVSSVDAAKLYYESFRELQKGKDRPLRVATIFSFAANEEQDA